MLSPEALRALLNTLAEPVVAVDARGALVEMNRAAEQALGVTFSQVAGRSLDEVPALHAHFEDVAPGTILPQADGSRWLVLPPRVAEPPTLASERVKRAIHSLKTPLSVAKSALDLLEDTDTPPEMRPTLIARAQENLEHMRAMIDKLLYAAWLESGEALDRASVNLDALVRRQVADLALEARAQGVTLRLALDGACAVSGDAAQLEEAIGNLISNAIKYSTPGGEVRVAVEPGPGTVEVRVEDEGIGIAPEHLPHLFEQFYRVQTPETRKIKGSGLGLSIAKTIVERHGGALRVESAPHAGSAFTLILPVETSEKRRSSSETRGV